MSEQATEAPTVEIEQFCGREWERPWLGKPFRFGRESIATNGHIMIKVPARAGDAAPYGAPKHIEDYIAKIFERAPRLAYSPVRNINLPPDQAPSKIECSSCAGRGHEHDCPECSCTCEDCGGSGEQINEPKVSTNFAGGLFNLKYVRQVLTLPGVQVSIGSSNAENSQPLLFEFDGGVGALMPLRVKYPDHIEIEVAHAQ